MRTLPRILLLIATFTLAACNTVAGIGKDLQKSGEFIEKSVK